MPERFPTVSSVLDFLTSKRPIVCPNPGWRQQLDRFIKAGFDGEKAVPKIEKKRGLPAVEKWKGGKKSVHRW